jgi:hypothetical protein
MLSPKSPSPSSYSTPKRQAHYIEGEPLEDKLVKACFEGNLELAKDIIENNKVDINGNESPNPLGWALITGNEKLAEYLVEKGANPKHQDTLPESLEELLCSDTDIGGFELTMRYTNYELEKENPQVCLERYCLEATLTLEILDRLISLGADIHCCNDLPLHTCLEPIGEEKDQQKIARCVAALRDRGADMLALDVSNYPYNPLDKALKQGLKVVCQEILKGYGELNLSTVVETHREKEAIKLAEKEITRRLKLFPDEILSRYLRIGSYAKVFETLTSRELSHRKAEKQIASLKKKTKNNNTIEI